MDILLKDVTIIDPHSFLHRQTADILIQKGFITDIGSLTCRADETVTVPGLHVSMGWTDVFAHFCDPGFEFRETLSTGAAAAAAGGFTDVFLLPNTQPATYTKSGIQYIVRSSENLPVNLHPLGAITNNTDGKELAEMYDMHQSGAIAFSDGLRPVQSAGVLLKALQYVKAVDKTIIQLPTDESISAQGQMNEGIVSTQLGLAGLPAIAEEILLSRDIELAAYSGSKIHFTGISTATSVNLIKKAKTAVVHVTCSVTPYHLYFSEDDLQDYNTALKVSPPLRTKEDKLALQQGVLDGTIDCIATHHIPQHSDDKVVEFEAAKAGMTGLETAFGAVRSSLPSLSLEGLVALFSTNARTIFELPVYKIEKNAKAHLSLFLPDTAGTVSAFFSKSRNSAFVGKELMGTPVGVITKEKLFLNT